MHLSLRDHIVSLTAVFLAMVVGILVGIALSSDESLRRQMDRQNARFNALMDETSALREELDADKTRLAAADRFAQDVASGLLGGRLTGARVALVYLGTRREPPFGSALEKMLRRSGADVVCQIMVPSDFSRRVLEAGPSVLQPAASSHEESTIPEGSASEAARMIARAVSRGGAQALFDRCEREGIAWAHGDTSGPPTHIVVVGQSEEMIATRTEELDLPFLRELIDEKVPTYACESLDTRPSLMHYYQRLGLSTIDNVDTALGQMALVLAMAANDRGDFGVKDTADRPYPPGL